jgi:hypothetical protein
MHAHMAILHWMDISCVKQPMLVALRLTAYDFFWSELSVIQENLLGFLFRDHGFFCQRSNAYSHATGCK